MTRTKCAVKITRKYIVASLTTTPNKPGIPSRRIADRPARYSIIKNASKSSGVGEAAWEQGKFANILPYASEIPGYAISNPQWREEVHDLNALNGIGGPSSATIEFRNQRGNAGNLPNIYGLPRCVAPTKVM